jgi:hypothetical protein
VKKRRKPAPKTKRRKSQPGTPRRWWPQAEPPPWQPQADDPLRWFPQADPRRAYPAAWRAPDPHSPLKWLFDEVDRRKKTGDIPTGRGAPTAFAKQLEQQMVVDVRAGKCLRAISWRSIRARLYDYNLLK